MDTEDQTTRELIGKEIRKARIDHGYTQAELARKLEVTQQFISSVERGVCDCPVWLIDSLSRSINLNQLKVCRIKGTLPEWMTKRIANRSDDPTISKILFLIASGREFSVKEPPRRSYRRY